MKKSIIISALIISLSSTANAQIGGLLKSKAKEAFTAKATTATNKVAIDKNSLQNSSKGVASVDTRGMEGKWKVEGIIVTTENEALKSQLEVQENQYNEVYKGYDWIFKKDGSISITAKDPNSGKVGTVLGQYELSGEKILMVLNNQPGEYTLRYEDGQMFLIQESSLNTIYFVFTKE